MKTTNPFITEATMKPSDLYKVRYRGPGRMRSFDEPEFVQVIIGTMTGLHHIKMDTDEPEISQRCQQLINLLMCKYPHLVPHFDDSFTKNCDS